MKTNGSPNGISKLEERYPNIKAVIILSASFFVLFMAFFSSANASAKALKDSGFNNMGFYSLSMLYLNFGLASLWTPRIVKSLHPKKSMVIASSFALASIRIRLELHGERLSRERVPVDLVTEVAAIVKAVERLTEDLAQR